ncbi:MAG: type II toxin-antitoxin system ParD family antitoxin [Rhodospirillaceae bacterium]|nr:type II toxin-antitoxin system ParD family antitoxin [Rhodospirillaceae bacterium]
MSTVEKRSVSLSSELAAAVDDAVASGEYGSASEVICDALRQWKASRDLHGYTVEELRRLWDEGINSGPSQPFTADTVKQIKQSALRRLKEEQERA